MELTHLRYFAHVAATQSFALGARRAHVSPPAMSKAIRKLEDELGAKLFERTTRRVVLTDSGRIVLARCRQLFEHVDGMRRDLDEAGGTVAGELRIAAMEVFSIHLLPMALARVARAHPALVPLTYEMLPELMERRLVDGQIDVGFTIGGGRSKDVDKETLGTSPGVVVCGKSHPLHARARLRPQEAARWPFVVPRFFQREHLPPLDQFPDDRCVRTVGATIELLQMGVQLAVAGVYLGCFPEVSVRHHLRSGALRAVRGLPAGKPFELCVLTRRGVEPRASVRALRDAVVRELSSGSG